jgi:hypothetical protein
MDFHTIMMQDVLPFVITAAIAALAKLLVDPKVLKLIDAFAANLASGTQKLTADADATHNALLIQSVHAAMSYAENNSDAVLKIADSKMDYVVSMIQADPRFAKYNLPLSAIKHTIEQLYTDYFADLSKPPVPSDVPGGPPTPTNAPLQATSGFVTTNPSIIAQTVNQFAQLSKTV